MKKKTFLLIVIMVVFVILGLLILGRNNNNHENDVKEYIKEKYPDQILEVFFKDKKSCMKFDSLNGNFEKEKKCNIYIYKVANSEVEFYYVDNNQKDTIVSNEKYLDTIKQLISIVAETYSDNYYGYDNSQDYFVYEYYDDSDLGLSRNFNINLYYNDNLDDVLNSDFAKKIFAIQNKINTNISDINYNIKLHFANNEHFDIENDFVHFGIGDEKSTSLVDITEEETFMDILNKYR